MELEELEPELKVELELEVDVDFLSCLSSLSISTPRWLRVRGGKGGEGGRGEEDGAGWLVEGEGKGEGRDNNLEI